jgi:putative transcriptional regulator
MALEEVDERFDYGEERHFPIAMGVKLLLAIIYTMRGDSCRIISARRQDMSKGTTIVRIGRDRTLERKTETGWQKIDVPQARSTGDPDNPAYDPDNPPRTEAQLARLKRVPRVRTLRRQLALTQEEFSARYHIPIGTLRDWEQGRTEPDAPAKAYLKVIAADPEDAAEKLNRSMHAAAE